MDRDHLVSDASVGPSKLEVVIRTESSKDFPSHSLLVVQKAVCKLHSLLNAAFVRIQASGPGFEIAASRISKGIHFNRWLSLFLDQSFTDELAKIANTSQDPKKLLDLFLVTSRDVLLKGFLFNISFLSVKNTS
jgi:hypothetical protein